MYLSGTVSVAMALLLSCFVVAKPEKHMVGREPVLPIAGESWLWPQWWRRAGQLQS